MKEQYAEVGLSALNKGDVVHVSYNSIPEKRLFLGLTVDYISGESLFTEEGEVFHRNYSRFYLVEKAKNPLPTELGAVIEHSDGWRFLRAGKNLWVGVGTVEGTVEGTVDTYWTDEELVNSADGDSNWKRVA